MRSGHVEDVMVDTTVTTTVRKEVHEEMVLTTDGWCGMFNHGRFGKDHGYYHMDFAVMKLMDAVHLDNCSVAQKYLNSGRNLCQGIYFDMEQNMSAVNLENFAKVLNQFDNLENLHLVFYQNMNLTLKIFKLFLQGLAKQKSLVKVSINLRDCTQVTDEWVECLGKALPGHLESLELWVYNCNRVTNVGLEHMMGFMRGCSALADVKLYAVGTSIAVEQERVEKIKVFVTEKRYKTIRMEGCGLVY